MNRYYMQNMFVLVKHTVCKQSYFWIWIWENSLIPVFFFFPCTDFFKSTATPFQFDQNLIWFDWSVYMKAFQRNWDINPIINRLFRLLLSSMFRTNREISFSNIHRLLLINNKKKRSKITLAIPSGMLANWHHVWATPFTSNICLIW